MCCLFAAIVGVLCLGGLRWAEKRRKTYDVAGASYRLFQDEEDGMELGRRGLRKYTYREIDPADLVLGEVLGKGAFGTVRRYTS